MLRWIAGFAIAVILTLFAVFNLQPVEVTLNPLDTPLQAPLYLIALMFMAGGFVLGAVTVWISHDPLHRAERRQRKTIKNLEKELKDVQGGPESGPPSEFFPALPRKK